MKYSLLVIPTLVFAFYTHATTVQEPHHKESEALSLEQIFTTYIISQIQEINRIGKTKSLPVPNEYRDMFKAVENNDWKLADEKFKYIQSQDNLVVDNAFWSPTLELYGTIEQYMLWSPDMFQIYGSEIEKVITPYSIYFGGTDSGRFILNVYSATSSKLFYVVSAGLKVV